MTNESLMKKNTLKTFFFYIYTLYCSFIAPKLQTSFTIPDIPRTPPLVPLDGSNMLVSLLSPI